MQLLGKYEQNILTKIITCHVHGLNKKYVLTSQEYSQKSNESGKHLYYL